MGLVTVVHLGTHLSKSVLTASSSWDNISWMLTDNDFQCSSENVTMLLADCILMHRCWTVYGKRLVVIILPALLWLGAVSCTALQMYLQIVHTHNALIGPRTWGAVNMSIGPGIAIIPFLAATIILNSYTTCALFSPLRAIVAKRVLGTFADMLIRRIYQVATKCDTATSTRQFRFIIRILAESGLLYLSITTAHFVAWFTTNDVAVQVLSMIVSLY